ncbi:D-alanyl-D-alanine carboxypeptidase/D-alanyl-D-alanine endopeptidase [Rugosimonospora africana]|uniref:D-alanyl-D-alanine carboxypeptidase/D-alanyl-D-alanine endopeptidase n=1 Tax=Rugosimonospora africana TaxID=556532 RepID=UPI00194458DD|nr:D-alanyl-D-alanine carboxypeptidase/D-alanyl-D-alanine-endopeptidase [Rugosimonospora africana]
MKSFMHLPRLRTALVAGSAMLVVATTAPVVLALTPAHAATTSMSTALDQILADTRLDGASVGVQVRDAASGTVLYSHDTDRRLIPASNDKLLTSTAALEVLGTDYRFHTKVLTGGQRYGSVLAGSVYLKGGGDPTMLAADYDQLAGQLAQTGVRVVTGDLVADDTFFDSQRLGADWAWDDEPYSYAAQISALTLAPDTDYDAGSVIVQTTGTTAGHAPTVTLVPANNSVRVDNRATTGPAGSANTLDVTRDHGTDTMVVTGSIPAGVPTDKEWMAVWDPTGYAAGVFRDALARHGVKVLGRTAEEATPAGAHEVADHPSMTLAQLLVPFLKLSNNIHAEALTKAMGQKVAGVGSWSAGIAAEHTVLSAMGVDVSTIRQVDGSGLSRQDLLTNQQITNLLVAARGKPWFGTWYSALPIAGVADRMVGGTLSSRMAGTPAANNLHGKTGSMTGVNALSGYVTDASGRLLVFSAIINNYLGAVTPLLDAIGVTLAKSTPDGVTPAAVPRAPRNAPVTDDAVECSWVKAC